MIEYYIAQVIHAERQAEVSRIVLGEAAFREAGAPNAARWLLNWAIAPWAQPSRASSARSTSGHSLSMMEK